MEPPTGDPPEKESPGNGSGADTPDDSSFSITGLSLSDDDRSLFGAFYERGGGFFVDSSIPHEGSHEDGENQDRPAEESWLASGSDSIGAPNVCLNNGLWTTHDHEQSTKSQGNDSNGGTSLPQDEQDAPESPTAAIERMFRGSNSEWKEEVESGERCWKCSRKHAAKTKKCHRVCNSCGHLRHGRKVKCPTLEGLARKEEERKTLNNVVRHLCVYLCCPVVRNLVSFILSSYRTAH